MKTVEELFNIADNVVDKLTDETNITLGELKIVGVLVKELMDDYLNSIPSLCDENYICKECEDELMGNNDEKM